MAHLLVKIKAGLVVGLLLIVFLMITLPAIFLGDRGGAAAFDQSYFNPFIETLRNNSFQIADAYEDNATAPAPSPGHFLLLSFFYPKNDFQVPSEITTIRIVNLFFGFLLILILALYSQKQYSQNSFHSFFLVLPLAVSYYTARSAIWISTDNGALFWGVLCLLCMLSAEDKPRYFVSACFFASMAIFWRQNYIFLMIPLLVSYLLRFRSPPCRWSCFLGLLIPLGVFGYLFNMWGGVAPPEMMETQGYGIHFNPASFIYIVVLTGIVGIFYLGFLNDVFRKGLGRSNAKGISVVFALSLFFVLSVHTDLNQSAGRWGGVLWQIGDYFPILHNRSLLVTGLFPAASVFLYILFLGMDKASYQARILLSSFLAWNCVCLSFHHAFHRYFEPFILIMFILLSIYYGSKSKRAYWGALVLGVLLLGASVYRIYYL